MIGAVWGTALGFITFKNTERPVGSIILVVFIGIALGWFTWTKSDEGTLANIARISAGLVFVVSQLASIYLTKEAHKNAD